MSLSGASVRRPVAVTVGVIAVLVLGVVSLSRLHIDLLPEITMPVAAVMVSYPGTGPEEMEQTVTVPLEGVLGTVPGLNSLSSFSQSGSSTLLLEFNWGTDMDVAALEIREKIGLVKGFLPSEVGDPVVVKMDPTLMPVLVVGISGGMDDRRLREFAEEKVKPLVERVEGVAGADVFGGSAREVKVFLSPEKLLHHGLSLNQVIQALAAENVNASGGYVEEAGKEYLLRVTGQFRAVDEIAQVSVTGPQGLSVKVGELGRVEDGTKDERYYTRLNGQPTVALVVRKQSDANTVDVVRRVKGVIEEIKAGAPAGVNFAWALDQSEFIEKAIASLTQNLIIGGILAILILYLFLRSVRATAIVGVAIPIAVIATFVLMYFDRQDINLMTLGGLALGVGMMVDNSIVVLENIFRHREGGVPAREAAVLGADEVAGAVTASTLTTVAVFLPVAFVEGLTAELFTPMALTISFSLLASLLVSLTLVPMVSAQVLGRMPRVYTRGDSGSNRIGRVLDWFAGRQLGLLERYRAALSWALGHRRRVLIYAAAVFAGSMALVPLISAEFFPQTDQGIINITVELPKGTALERTAEVMDRVDRVVRAQPEAEVVYATSGGQMAMAGQEEATESGSVNVILCPKDKRRRSAEEVAAALDKELKLIPGAKITASAADPLTYVAGQLMPSPIQVRIKGDDLAVLRDLSLQAAEILRKVPGAVHVESALEEGKPEWRLVVDRQRAAAYGLSPAVVSQTVRAAFQGQVATKYRTGSEEVDVRVQLDKGGKVGREDIANLLVASPLGFQVPVKAVARLEEATGPSSIERHNQIRTVAVQGGVQGRPLGEVVRDAQRALSELKLPPGYEIEFGGEAEQMSEAFSSLGVSFVLAVILVYLVMAAQFESFFQPFVIMFTLPLAAIGVVWFLLLSGYSFGVTAFIGVIMLAGIVVNNAIVLITYVNILRGRGLSREEAILQAGPARLRPILMTALTTVLGLLPLALGLGEGGEMDAPLGAVVIGGLLVSTILTLVVIPVVYTVFEDLGRRWGSRARKAFAGNRVR